MVLEQQSMVDLVDAIKILDKSFDSLPDFTPDADTDVDAIRSILNQVAEKMQDNYGCRETMLASNLYTMHRYKKDSYLVLK